MLVIRQCLCTASPTQASNPASLQVQVKVEPMEDAADSRHGCHGRGGSHNFACDGGSFGDGRNAAAVVKTVDVSDKPGRVEDSCVPSGMLKGEVFEFGSGQIILQGEDCKVEQDPYFVGDTDSEAETETEGGKKKLALFVHHSSSVTEASDIPLSAQASARPDIGMTSSSDCGTFQLAPFCTEKCSPSLNQSRQSVSASLALCQDTKQYSYVHCEESFHSRKSAGHQAQRESFSSNSAGNDVNSRSGRGESFQISDMSLSRSCRPIKQYSYVHCEENFHKRKSTDHQAQSECPFLSNAAGVDANARSGRDESFQISNISLSRSGEAGNNDEVEMETGQQKHVRKPHKKYQCQECGQNFGWSSHLKAHLENVHRGEKNHQCPQCNKDFSLRGTLNWHLKTVHQGERRYMCFECGGNFSRQSVLDRHMETVHQGRRRHECFLCRGTFGREGDLQRHMATLH